MLTRVVEFTPTSNAAAEFTKIVEQTALGIVQTQAGCIVAFVKAAGKSVIGVSVWQSQAAAEQYARECYPLIVEMLRPFLRCAPRVYTLDSPQIQSRGSLSNRKSSKAVLSILRQAQAVLF